MPWEKSYDETEVLDSAMKAFWSRGYEATSLQDLVQATGINRGSIYNAFPGKRGLFMRALEHYDRIYRIEHLNEIAETHDPVEAIISVFKPAVTKPINGDTPWGCLLVNTALELSPHDPEVAEFVDHSLRGVENFFYSRIEAAKQDKTINASLDSKSAAKSLLGLYLGFRVLTRTNIRQSTIDAITSQARMMLV